MGAAFGSSLYSAGERGELPAEVVAASLGCGNPTAVAELRAGEKVLDLGPSQRRQGRVSNVDFLQGTIEDIPLPDASVNVVISNCVINLSCDKPVVFAEMLRVLTPGGRIGISDVVADNDLTPAERGQRGSYVGCIAGALSQQEYLDGLTAVGFTNAEVSFTHEVAPGMHSAIVRDTKPGDQCYDTTARSSCREPAAKPTRRGGTHPATTDGCQ